MDWTGFRFVTTIDTNTDASAVLRRDSDGCERRITISYGAHAPFTVPSLWDFEPETGMPVRVVGMMIW